jgi:hypothetical protein
LFYCKQKQLFELSLTAHAVASQKMVTSTLFCLVAQGMLCRNGTISTQKVFHRNTQFLSKFCSHFGVTPEMCCIIWNKCFFPLGVNPEHLLWALLFLKLYATEEVLCNFAGTTRKTFRKWTWIVIKAISQLAPQVVCISIFG